MSTETAVAASPLQRAQSLWSGGGGAGSASRHRRLRYRVRTLATEHPGPYLRFARRKYPGPSPRVIGPDTEAVIDGYTRSASTFAVYAFQVAQPTPVRLAHHLHAPAQLMAAARRGLPTLMVIREPRGALLSQLVREPDVDLLDALYAYRRFHTSLMPYRDAFVVADFREVTADFGAVVRRLNAKFGTSFGVFGNTPEEHELCTALIAQRPTLSPVLLGFESGETTLEEARRHLAGSADPAAGEATWIPSPERDAAKAALERLWDSPRVAVARGRAVQSYHDFTGGLP
jgi:hypothetical protein